MPCCTCHCSPCTCNTTEIRVPAPQVQVLHMGGTDPNCCPIKGWYEALEVTSLTVPAAGSSGAIAVCDATQYPVGTCVMLMDASGNRRVVKVTGWNNDRDAIYVLSYANAAAIGSATLSGNINSYPLALCPVETTDAGVLCDRDYMVTAEAFVQPTAITSGGGTVKLVFDKPQTLQLGMSIYVVGAGYMQVSVPPSGTFVECGTEFYVYNLGAAGNTSAGVTVPSGAAAYPDPVPSASAATTPSAGDLPEFRHAYAETPAQQTVSSPGTDNVIYAEIAVSENEVVEVYGQMLTFSPQLSIAFTLLSGSGAKLGNSTPGQTRTYEDDGSNGGIPRLPAYSSTHREFWKATANTTLRFAWTWSTGPHAPATCAAVIAQRYIELRVVGVMP